jgi:hypothetical protein
MQRLQRDKPFDLAAEIRQAAIKPCCGLYTSVTDHDNYLLRWRANLGFGPDMVESGILYSSRDWNEFARVTKLALGIFQTARGKREKVRAA